MPGKRCVPYPETGVQDRWDKLHAVNACHGLSAI